MAVPIRSHDNRPMSQRRLGEAHPHIGKGRRLGASVRRRTRPPDLHHPRRRRGRPTETGPRDQVPAASTGRAITPPHDPIGFDELVGWWGLNLAEPDEVSEFGGFARVVQPHCSHDFTAEAEHAQARAVPVSNPH
jgi:hypothetical protein